VVLKNSNSVSGVGGALENKYNLSQANIVQDSSTAVDLRNPDSSPGRTPYAGNVLNSIEIEDNSRSPGSVQFTSLVSAAFWLVYCPNWMSSDVISLVDQIYKNAVKVPYLCRFHVYARRRQPPPGSISKLALSSSPAASAASPAKAPNTKSITSSATTKASSNQKEKAPNNPAHVRILCLTEPARAVHPLELQEDFVEIARSNDYVEIRDKSRIEVQFGGNLYKSMQNTNEDDENCDEFEYDSGGHKLIFHPFIDNRQGFAVKRRNENNPYGKGSISILTSGSERTLFEAKIDLSKFM